jgi:oxygen-independent coproporphyrinogen-3 oxidase
MAGIYTHIPFCKQRCTYCDFHFSTSFEVYREAVIKAIAQELILRKNEISEKIQTIYFGGGTPSLLLKSELELIINTVKDNFILGQNVEITLEANPEDISIQNLILWKEQGINRLSIGLQSFKESDLTWMNRSHNVAEGIKSVKLAQSYGFKNNTYRITYRCSGVIVKLPNVVFRIILVFLVLLFPILKLFILDICPIVHPSEEFENILKLFLAFWCKWWRRCSK